MWFTRHLWYKKTVDYVTAPRGNIVPLQERAVTKHKVVWPQLKWATWASPPVAPTPSRREVRVPCNVDRVAVKTQRQRKRHGDKRWKAEALAVGCYWNSLESNPHLLTCLEIPWCFRAGGQEEGKTSSQTPVLVTQSQMSSRKRMESILIDLKTHKISLIMKMKINNYEQFFKQV